MDSKCDKITLYTAQRPIVLETLDKQGLYHVKKEFIEMKYGEVSNIFFESYNWFVSKAKEIVERPSGAEYPIWLFTDPKYTGASVGDYLLTLSIPKNQVILFSMNDWNNILNLHYLPTDDKDYNNFRSKLNKYNIIDESQVCMSSFYPQLKSQVKKSWNKLFDNKIDATDEIDNKIDATDEIDNKIDATDEIDNKIILQASIWEIRKNWIVNTTAIE